MRARGRRGWVIGILSAWTLAVAPSASAGTVTLGTDTPVPVNGELRYEIENTVPGETVTINPGVNPVLTQGQIEIGAGDNVTIVGQGAFGGTTIDTNAAQRLFRIDSGGTAVITGARLTGGDPPDRADESGDDGFDGGAIRNSGVLSLRSVYMNSNSAGDGGSGVTGNNNAGIGGLGGDGGAVYNGSTGSLTIESSLIVLNVAGRGGDGGDGADTVSGKEEGGDGGSGGDGGGISNDGSMTVISSLIEDNRAGRGGNGGTGGDDPTDAVVSGGNGGTGGEGGGLASTLGTLVITGSTITANEAGLGGTGGFGGLGDGTLPRVAGLGGPGGHGGGVFSEASTTLINSTVAGGEAGLGGTGGPPGDFGDGGHGGEGGGLYAATGSLVAIHATIANNRAGDGGVGTGVNGFDGHGGDGGGAHEQGVTLSNSLLAGNLPGSGETAGSGPNCGAIGGGTLSLSFPDAGDCPGFLHGDPLLGPLAGNGGPTPTMALGSGSAAIDQVPSTGAGCTATDQRGSSFLRPSGAACDIGAFEVQVPPPGAAAPGAATPKRKCKKGFKLKRVKTKKGKKKRKCVRKKKRRKRQQ